MAQVTAHTPGAHAGPGLVQRIARDQPWWLLPATVVAVLGGFTLYVFWTAFVAAPPGSANHVSEWGPYLSPFFSPTIWKSGPISPAIWVLWSPLVFRGTCYYYRKAYYRSFFWDPPACAIGELRHREYHGESRFPMVLNNLHRFTLYAAGAQPEPEVAAGAGIGREEGQDDVVPEETEDDHHRCLHPSAPARRLPRSPPDPLMATGSRGEQTTGAFDQSARSAAAPSASLVEADVPDPGLTGGTITLKMFRGMPGAEQGEVSYRVPAVTGMQCSTPSTTFSTTSTPTWQRAGSGPRHHQLGDY